MRRRLVAGGVLAAVVLVIIALVAGGGDDDEPTDDVTTIGATGDGVAALTGEQLADQADLICADADAALEDVDATDSTELIQREVAIATDELNQLRTLQTGDVDPAYADFIDALDRRLDLLQKQALATEREDDAAVVELEEKVDAAAADAEDAADSLGFEECAGIGAGDGEETADTGETGGTTPAPTTPTTPAPTTPEPTTPAPTAPPDTGGGATTPAPTTPAPEDGGDTDGTGGITPE